MNVRLVVAITVAALALSCASQKAATKHRRRSHSSSSSSSAEVGTTIEGSASYYADMLAGRPTASGEPYTPGDHTCAHRSLPFGTQLQLTVVESGATSHCRVNDRGPFAKERVLDVSKSVARELGMLGPGHLNVRAVVVDGGGDDDG